MSRFIPHTDMAAEQLFACVKDAMAILDLCHQVAWDIQNCGSGQTINQLADAIQQVTGLANEMLVPVYEALESHEGGKAGGQGGAS